ncbi:MAG TPA: hypothetical protein PLZ95_10595 [Bryobacteraceae bacterium]|nr:hypothetical protein [Bryobacteraceae bacterium]
MKAPRQVDDLWLEATCACINLAQWNRWTDGATRADHRLVNSLVRRHLPDLCEDLRLDLRNPYHYFKTRRHLILVHSAIEYFLAYRREGVERLAC